MNGWERVEVGWYYHEDYGAICQERNGWFLHIGDSVRMGPYKTLTEAKTIAAEIFECEKP